MVSNVLAEDENGEREREREIEAHYNLQQSQEAVLYCGGELKYGAFNLVSRLRPFRQVLLFPETLVVLAVQLCMQACTFKMTL